MDSNLFAFSSPLAARAVDRPAHHRLLSLAEGPLVQLARKGDAAAFRSLFDRYHRQAFAVALGVVQDRHLALAITGGAFVELHGEIHGFRSGAHVQTTLYRILLRRSLEERESHPGPRSGPKTSAYPIAVREALGALSDEHRVVLLLREVGGLTYEQMARALELATGVVTRRLFEARCQMQRALEPAG